MTPLHLFQMIVEFAAAVFGGLAVVVAFCCLCIAVVSEIVGVLQG